MNLGKASGIGAGRPTWRPALVILAAVAMLQPESAAAQRPAVIGGRVVRVAETDTVGVGGARVVLHRVGRERQGPIDSTVAGPDGAFRFRFPPDTASIYLLSSSWAGIEYFSTPLRTNPEAPDTGLIVAVSDTSSTAPVAVASRHIVVSQPGQDGTRPVLEIVVLANTGSRTRVARDTIVPTWATRLPAGVLAFQAGEGEYSPGALITRHDSVLLFAPIAPGEKQLVFSYTLPAAPGRVRIPVGDSIAIMNFLLEELDRTVSGGGMEKADTQSIEGRTFQQWSGAVAPGSVIEFDLPSGNRPWLLPVLVGAVALVLAGVAASTLSRRPAAPPSPTVPSVLDQIAQLDARYAGREADLPAAEWRSYQERRTQLKSMLATDLARGEHRA